MEFILTSSEIKKNTGANQLFERLKQITAEREGYCYYKYPVAGGTESHLPDIVIVDNEFGICAFDVLTPYSIDSINSVVNDKWTINGQEYESPFLKLEDYQVNLGSKFNKFRQLRNKIAINWYVILPIISKVDFEQKFQGYNSNNIIFSNFLDYNYDSFWKEKSTVTSADDKKLFLSISQGAGALNDPKKVLEAFQSVKKEKMGDAIKLIDTKIAILDKNQHAAALQIPDGPQRIRGMAGTGKTIILARKAAFLHSKYPDKKILYTFHTQSLYNQVRNLITKYYRDDEGKDPDWDNLLILHSWGGKSKEGVYYRTCLRNSIRPIELREAEAFNKSDALGYVCSDALKHKLNQEYDYVLIDEAQDFTPPFFQMIWETTHEPKRIIFAYDELQSLNKIKIEDTGELFGFNPDGTKKVDLTKQNENGIESDFVLQKSYRNPLEVLMVAHSIGLGLYNPDGDMQIIDDKGTWAAIGYEVISGNFREKGEQIEILRPDYNSESVIKEMYSGKFPPIEYEKFNNREEELKWIANRIQHDINQEGVNPEEIVVITLDASRIRQRFGFLQNVLFSMGIPSIIPGVGGVERDKYAEKGFVTLSTVYKAKGNEAFVVYVSGFDYLYDYVDFILARNTAFTSISRTKGWCRITGVGDKMNKAIIEITKTLENVPRFKFSFPDAKNIARRLSQEEYAKRASTRKKGENAIKELLNIDDNALNLEGLTEEQKAQLRKKLGL